MKFVVDCSYNNDCSFMEMMNENVEVRPSSNMKRIGFYVGNICVGVYDNRTFKLTVY